MLGKEAVVIDGIGKREKLNISKHPKKRKQLVMVSLYGY